MTAMHLWLPSIFVAVACVCAPSATVASTLYEDQQGSTSWIKECIGDVQYAARSDVSDVYLTSSDYGIAAISLDDGSFLWKREVEVSMMHVFDSVHRVVTVSETDVYSWSLPLGQLEWSTGARTNDLVKASCRSVDGLVILQSGHASLLDAQTGHIRWKIPLPNLSEQAYCVLRNKTAIITILGGDGRKDVSFTHVDIFSGLVHMTANTQVLTPLSTHGAVINDTFMALSDDLQQLCAVHAWTTASSCVLLPSEPSGPPVIHATEYAVVISIPHSTGSSFYITNLTPEPSFLPLPPSISAVSLPISLRSAPKILAITHVDSTMALHVLTIDLFTAREERRDIMPGYPAVHADGAVAQPVQVWPGTCAHGHTPPTFLLQAEDLSLLYNSGFEWLWGRDEALAEATEMVVLDVALPDATEASWHMPTGRLSTQHEGDAYDTGHLGQTFGIVVELISSIRDHLVKYLENVHINNSKQKVVVVACQNGMYYGLHANSGRRIWASRLQHGTTLVTMEPYPCYRGVMEDTQLLVVARHGAGSLAVLLDPVTGLVVHMSEVPSVISHVHFLDRGNCASFGVLMAGISAPFLPSLPVYVFPTDMLIPKTQETSLWAVDKASGCVVGYNVLAGSSLNTTTPLAISAESSWTFSLRGILLAAIPVVRSPHSSHHVKIHADRSMSFRYLSPNMALIVSETEAAPAASGLTFAILDTASGRLLHSQVHVSACGPVAAAFYDNVAAVHFFDRVSSRWQMTIMKLYDSSSPVPTTLQVLWGIVTGSIRKASNTLAANPTLLTVSRTSIFTPAGVQALHPIQTRFGVTRRHLLMATLTNQIYNLDTKFIDPDRTKLLPKHSGRQETDPIHTTQLALLPQWFATYDQKISSLRSIRTSPSHLESTVHLMAWGTDVYHAELRPSHGFDTLGDDFSFMLLIFAIVGMGSAVVALSKFVQAARICARWE